MAATAPPAAAPPAAVTADEFLRHAATHESDELVNGVIIPMSPAGGQHHIVAGTLLNRLFNHVEAHELGDVFPDNAGYHLPIPGRARDTVRSPDVSFVAAGRLPVVPKGFMRLAPDLAAEVLSPDNTAAEMGARIADYLAAGTRLVWVVDPDRRTVAVYSASAPVRWLGPADALDGGDVVPGFALPVAALFRRLDRAPAAGPA
jgi:Uma2 family endonuclease